MAKRTDNFKQFEKKPKGSAIKEKIKQEKKKEKKERAVAIEEHFARKREDRLRQRGIDPATIVTGKPGKFNKGKTTNKYTPKAAPVQPEHAKPAKFEQRKKHPGSDKNKGFPKRGGTAPAPQRAEKQVEGEDFKRPFDKSKSAKPERTFEKRESRPPTPGKPPYVKNIAPKKYDTPKEPREPKAPYTPKASTPPKANSEARVDKFIKQDTVKKDFDKKPFKAPQENKTNAPRDSDKPVRESASKPYNSDKNKGGKPVAKETSTELMPLNKYIAHSGVCARRDAAELVKNGKVTVNDELILDPGTKVSPYDIVKASGNTLTISKNFVYILLNKPKDYITTSEDPQGRKTVLDLVRTATAERVYPVGRLDRNTSGVLLLTNDGDLAQKLSHPKHEIKKVYEVRLDRNLTKHDMEKIGAGINLEDGMIAPDVIAYADSKDKSIIGIEIHSGRNRIVRRIFEHMKYDVKALDRVMFAGLTKKDVQRGNWRFLKEKEVRLLKYMNQSYVKAKD